MIAVGVLERLAHTECGDLGSDCGGEVPHKMKAAIVDEAVGLHLGERWFLKVRISRLFLNERDEGASCGGLSRLNALLGQT